MKRATLLTVVVALLLALTAGAAVAANFTGTDGPDTITGTAQDDSIRGLGGNDELRGSGGNDVVQGEEGADDFFEGSGDDRIKGGPGNDMAAAGVGSDELFGQTGNDTLRTTGDTERDFVNCGEDADGLDVDTASVSGNDLVDGTRASGLITTEGLTCERVIVEGIRIPSV